MKSLNKCFFIAFPRQKGQATFEYIILLAVVGVMLINVTKLVGSGLSTTAGNLGFNLTKSLKTGVCAQECFYNGYKNLGATYEDQ